VVKKNEKVSTYQSKNSNFSLEELVVSKTDTIPIRFGRLNLNTRDYKGYSPDS